MLDSIADVLREVRSQALRVPHASEEGLKAHRRILKGVKSGNASAARSAMAEHLAEAERVWIGSGKKPKTAATAKSARSRSRSV
jgi:DNA-binding FadR family transcriptional regulator